MKKPCETIANNNGSESTTLPEDELLQLVDQHEEARMQIKLCVHRIITVAENERERRYKERVRFKCTDKFYEGKNMILTDKDLKLLDTTEAQIRAEKRFKNDLSICKNVRRSLKKGWNVYYYYYYYYFFFFFFFLKN